MTAKIKDGHDEQNFKPFKIEVGIERVEEAAYLWYVFNIGVADIVDHIENETHNTSSLERLMLNTIKSGLGYDLINKSMLWNVINDELKEQGVITNG